MWRDILLIAAFALAGLMYFGLTPRRLSAYAKNIKGEITKRRLYQRIFLFILVALASVYIFVAIWKLETTELSTVFLGIAFLTLAWCVTLSDVWKLSERGERVVNVVMYSVFLPSLVTSIILDDMPLWQKFAYPLGGFGVGFGLRLLVDYIGRKLKTRRSSKEGNKKPKHR